MNKLIIFISGLIIGRLLNDEDTKHCIGSNQSARSVSPGPPGSSVDVPKPKLPPKPKPPPIKMSK